MKVAVSKPLSRQQGDSLNTQRTTVANAIGAIFTAGTSAVSTPFVGAVVGTATRAYTNEVLPTYHAGDVLVSIEAQVNGGIGPQRSITSLIIKA
jgi:hypothetical protein|nr:hypothetical protein [Pseudomonas mosselii]